MAIKIHHGPNGSYKTSGAVWDDAVPAAKEGRTIITNVRGLSEDRFRAMFPDLPDSFDLEYIDHQTMEGMERIRTWFQWAPRNAFLIFDEAQTLFPKKWNDKFLERFDFPGGMDAAKEADRPMNFLDAWTRHRHWNWDVILTTPNIKYIHDEIRNTSEMAYQHSNLALLGKALKFLVQKDYKEAMHSAQENKAPADGSTIVQLRKIDKRVFKLYDSTATGQHRDTMAGKNALMSPKVMGLLGLVAAVFIVLYYRNGTSMFHLPLADSEAPAAPVSPPVSGVLQSSAIPVIRDAQPQSVQSDPLGSDPYASHQISIRAAMRSDTKGITYLFDVTANDKSFSQNSRDMAIVGYTIASRGLCAADLTYQGTTRTVVCSGALPDGGGAAKRLGAERQGSAAVRAPLESQVTVIADSEYASRPWR